VVFFFYNIYNCTVIHDLQYVYEMCFFLKTLRNIYTVWFFYSHYTYYIRNGVRKLTIYILLGFMYGKNHLSTQYICLVVLHTRYVFFIYFGIIYI